MKRVLFLSVLLLVFVGPIFGLSYEDEQRLEQIVNELKIINEKQQTRLETLENENNEKQKQLQTLNEIMKEQVSLYKKQKRYYTGKTICYTIIAFGVGYLIHEGVEVCK